MIAPTIAKLSALLVASTGGHLEQLLRLRPRLGELARDPVWVTFDTPQSRSRLAGEENVVFARYTAPRDWGALARNVLPAQRILRERNVQSVVSTGAGIALAFIPAARARAIPCHYIESAARGSGPSLTGRVLLRTPGVRLYTQHRSWAHRPWQYVGSVFDGFTHEQRTEAPRLDRIVVTLGTIGYGFLRLVHRLHEILPPDAEVLWQTGSTDVTDLGIDARQALPAHELDQAIRAADVVIAHAGIGSALQALDAGHCPVLTPRRAVLGEHVDDHQRQIAGDLDQRGLAVAREAEELTIDDLRSAAARRVVSASDSPALDLRGN